jgi:hypothetical protein
MSAGYVTGWLKKRTSDCGTPTGGHPPRLYVLLVPGEPGAGKVQFMTSCSNPPTEFYKRVVASRSNRNMNTRPFKLKTGTFHMCYPKCNVYSAVVGKGELTSDQLVDEFNRAMGFPSVTTHHTSWSAKKHYNSVKFQQRLLHEITQADKHANGEVG